MFNTGGPEVEQRQAHAWQKTVVSLKLLTFLIRGKKESTSPSVA